MKLKGMFGLFLFLFLIFGFSLNLCSDTHAESILSGIYSTAIYSKNFESSDTVYNQGPVNTGGTGVINVLTENNPTGIWDYTQALSFPNPFTNKVGTGYQSTLYFTMHSVDGPYLNVSILQKMASNNLGFENLSEDMPYCTQSWNANVQDSSTVQFILRSTCPYGTYPANTSFDQVEANINFKPDSIFWCANDNAGWLCPSSFRVTLYNIDYYFGVLTSSDDSYNQTIINQNQTIINQNQTIIDRDSQDREDLQNQSDTSQNSADDASNSVTNAGQSLLVIIGNFINIVTHPPQSDCVINADMGNLDLGYIDLCQLTLPQPLQVLSTILLIGMIIPFAYSLIMTILNLLKGATQN